MFKEEQVMSYMEEMLRQVEALRIVPVVKLDRSDDAVPLVGALCEGGLPVAEITFRTDAAEESIRETRKAFPEACIGAGTAVNTEQAKRAEAAGAQFIVTPGFSGTVTKWAVENNMPIFPGACTPSEILQVMEYGLSVVKFFPAAQFGGLKTIKALAAPFPSLRFMPTGGVSADNLKEYLAFDKIIACGGSWMVKDSLINAGKFDEIRVLTAEAVSLARA